MARHGWRRGGIGLTLGLILGAAGETRAVDVADFQARAHRISGSPDKSLPYRLFVPRAYKAGTRLPLMITLHGAGERGTNNTSQLAHDFNKRWAEDSVQAKHPCFVLAPQCPPDNKWVDVDWALGTYDQSKVPMGDELRTVVAILDSLEREFTLDPDRIYVSGLSMGGYGTWDLVARYPARFAAAVAVCGAGDTARAKALKSLPIWAFHAEDDLVVPVKGSREMVAALRAAGGNVKYTEYPASQRVGHASWVPAGRDPGLTAWVFSQVRASTTLAPAASASRPAAALRSLQDGRLRFPTDPRGHAADGLVRLAPLD